MEATGNSVANLDPRYTVADDCNLTRAIGERHDAELCRIATAAFEDHQVAVIKRARAHSHQDLLRSRSGVLARPKRDPVNAAEAVDAVGFHLFLLRLSTG